MESIKFKSKCTKHPDYKIEYIRITTQDGLQSQQQGQKKPLFVCQYCLTKDQTINLNDYISIKYILKSGIKEFIPSWPPINKPEIIKDLFSLIDGAQSNQQNETIQKIIYFFTNLKQTINESIDICQKNMIKLVEELIPPKSENQDILKKYQEISKINQLTSHLLNNTTDLQQKEISIEELIQSLNNSKTEQDLKQLILNNSQNVIFNSESACVIQEQIVQSIHNIQLFTIKPSPAPTLPSKIQPERINFILAKTNYNGGYNKLEIAYNDKKQQVLSFIKEYTMLPFSIMQAVSTIRLDINKKYIIRVKIDNLQGYNYIYLGLMKQNKIHTNSGWQDKLCCRLQNQGNNIISLYNDGNGIEKQIQGDKFELSNEKEVEFRICIQDLILHVLDYPSYKYKIGLDDQYIQNLINEENLVFFIELFYQNSKNSKVTLTDALIVQSFE